MTVSNKELDQVDLADKLIQYGEDIGLEFWDFAEGPPPGPGSGWGTISFRLKKTQEQK